MWLYHSLFNHLTTEGFLDSFQFWQLYIQLLSIYVFKVFCEYRFSYFKDKYFRHRVGQVIKLVYIQFYNKMPNYFPEQMNFKTLSPHLKLKNIMSQSLCLTTKHVLQNSRRKILPTHIYPKIYHICCSPFISHVSCFPLPSFPCFLKNFTAASSSDISHIFSIILSLHLLKLRSQKYYTFYYLIVS